MFTQAGFWICYFVDHPAHMVQKSAYYHSFPGNTLNTCDFISTTILLYICNVNIFLLIVLRMIILFLFRFTRSNFLSLKNHLDLPEVITCCGDPIDLLDLWIKTNVTLTLLNDFE